MLPSEQGQANQRSQLGKAFRAVGIGGYTIGLKKWLVRDGWKAYHGNRWNHAAAVAVAFTYYSMTLFFFAPFPGEIKALLSVLR
jgi:hypothetical protein